jgi:hypothetical protein
MKIMNLFTKRKQAYENVFNPESKSAQYVLADLQKFCRGRGTKFMGDTEKTLVMVGRNEVWERIQSYLNIPESQLTKISEIEND